MSTGADSLVDREISVRHQQTRVRQVDLTESDRAVIPGPSSVRPDPKNPTPGYVAVIGSRVAR
jgi:hypothetical protein